MYCMLCYMETKYKQYIVIDRKYGKKHMTIFLQYNQFTFFIHEIIYQSKFESVRASYNVRSKFINDKIFRQSRESCFKCLHSIAAILLSVVTCDVHAHFRSAC